jgi:hypothetical protein
MSDKWMRNTGIILIIAGIAMIIASFLVPAMWEADNIPTLSANAAWCTTMATSTPPWYISVTKNATAIGIVLVLVGSAIIWTPPLFLREGS